VIEAIVNGKYYWVPVSRLIRIEIEKPADLRDFVWAPATLTLENGAANVALIPTRYPGTEREADQALYQAKRAGRNRFIRNVLIAIGNSGDTTLTAEAERALPGPLK